MIGYTNNSPLSNYQPTQDVVNITKTFRDAFNDGVNILTRGWEELNLYSVTERMNKDQRAFNSFVDEGVDDPKEAWKWRGTRSMERNKAMAMHAHLTATLAIPMAFAQNEKQEEDRDMSMIMRDILEWMAQNSEYKESYILATMGSLVNTATFMGIEWMESYANVKEKTDEGYSVKQVLDEESSGLRCPVYSADQILLTNVFEQNAQRQYIMIRRVYKDYHALEQKWGWHPNWQYVTQGIKTVYSTEEGLFYDIRDDEHPSLCEEATGWCRKNDTEVAFVNGIYMGTPNVDWNPMKHRSNTNQPKVPVVPFGYERINEHFFYWKSLMNRVGWDDVLIDAMYENVMNRETQDLNATIVISGADHVDSAITIPGSGGAFGNPDVKAQPLIPANRVSGYKALREIEKSMSEASVSEVQMGVLPDAEQKAFTVARAEQNARTILRGAFRSIGESVAKVGQLMIDIALQNLTTAQFDEITGAVSYRPFILQDQMVNGKQVSKKIIFDESLMNGMSEDRKKMKAMELLEKTEWPENKEHIYLVNPHLFSKMKYLVRIEPDVMMEKNEAFEQATTERMYSLLRADPLINPEFLVRKLVESRYHGESDEALAKKEDVARIMGTMDTKPPQNMTEQTKCVVRKEPAMA